MGREIRRVPADWQHPVGEDGRYIPLLDKTYEEALKEYELDLASDPEWAFIRDEDCYRPAFASEATHYQIYETVTEGKPCSPVFETLGEMVEWLVLSGYSRRAVQNFANNGWVPSYTRTSNRALYPIRRNSHEYRRSN